MARETKRARARGKVACWAPSFEDAAGLLPPYDSDAQELDIVVTSALDETRQELGKPGDAVLLTVGFGKDARELASRLRGEMEWAELPFFAAVSYKDVNEESQQRAESLRVELQPQPMPARLFWGHLRESLKRFRGKAYRFSPNRRRFFRVPFSVTAYSSVQSRTVDISLGGVQIQTDHPYKLGEQGMLDIPLMREQLPGGLRFEVIAVDPLEDGEFRFRVRGRFVELDEQTTTSLARALYAMDPEAYNEQAVK
ncbi:MAG: PilZ domain-containing protein [Planctomycetota bacterium]|nr:PilZ domain-containing protein [Planctomycetota bacterium]